jgi:hypothetical protein
VSLQEKSRIDELDDPLTRDALVAARSQRRLRTRRVVVLVCLTAGIGVLVGVLLGSGSGGTPPPPLAAGGSIPVQLSPGTPQPGQSPLGTDFFASNSVWNSPLSPTAALDPNSAAMVTQLATTAAQEGAAGTGPFVQTYSYSTPIYIVGASQPTVEVAVDTDQNSTWVHSLQGAFNAVPLPANAQPAAGTDSQLTVYQPSTDRMWEFWDMRHLSDGWHARWGGAIQSTSKSPGFYSTNSWPGALPVWGASATSLPLVAGTMTLADLRSGQINHALAMSLPYPRQGVFVWPAQRSDGTGTLPNSIPEGAHLRLNPSLNIPAMHLPKIVEMMALAAQRYGIIVRDQTHANIGFFAEDPTQYGAVPYTASDPYFGQFRDANGTPDPVHGRPDPNALFDGMWPSTFMSYFPWSDLQVLNMGLSH